MRRLALTLAFGASLTALIAGPVAACSVDGVPSAFANNTRAVIYKVAPTAATYAYWACFAFPHAYRAGQRITFHEADALVRPVLTLADLRRPWRWRYGDGTSTMGDRVTHVYRRAGTYKVAVDAYYPHYGGWQQFDSITISVVRG